MAQSDPTQSVTSSEASNSPRESSAAAVEPAQRSAAPQSAQAAITSDQAEQIISQLKSLKQNVFILTLVAGFFALRAILFHR